MLSARMKENGREKRRQAKGRKKGALAMNRIICIIFIV